MHNVFLQALAAEDQTSKAHCQVLLAKKLVDIERSHTRTEKINDRMEKLA